MATRRERVVLDLEDNFTAGMIRAAAATEFLNQRVNSLSKNAVESRRANRDMGDGFEDAARKAQRADSSINQLSGRLGLLANVAGALGPSLIPIGAIAVPAVAGLASQFGFAAVGAGVALGAFQGVGTALKAMNTAALDPTAAHLKAAQLAMAQLSPTAREFVKHLRTMGPELKKIRDIGAENMFPGLTEGLDGLEAALPRVEKIFSAVSSELGNIGADAGTSLGGARWAPFLDFLAVEAPAALADMATAAGNTGHAMAELWMAFAPSNRKFSSWMVDATNSLDEWASGLSKTQSFAEFMDYLDKTGPQVGETLGAIANAVLQIVEAAAPIGGPILAGIEAFAKAIAAIADSDLGTPIFGAVAAFSALNLAMRATKALNATTFSGPLMAGLRSQGASLKGLRADWVAYNAVTRTSQGRAQATASQMIASRAAAERLGGTLRTTAVAAGKAGALIGGLAIATSGAADGIGLTNTASLALMGTMVGGGLGAAIGSTVGLTMDLAHAGDNLNDSLTQLGAVAGKVSFDAFNTQLANTQKQIDDLKHSTGLGDLISDTLKGASATLHGQGLTTGQITGNLQKKADAAEAVQDAALRNRGAAAANRFAAQNAALAAKGFHLVGDAATSASRSVQGFTSSMQSANDVLKRKGSIDAYASSLLDAADALKENGKTLDGSTRKGLANRAMLRQIAGGAIEAGTGMKNFEKRTLFLDKARGDFIKMAEAMGATPAKARSMANSFGLVDRVSRKGAISVKEMRSQIADLKDKIVKVEEKGGAGSKARVAKLRAEIAALQGKVAKVEEKGAAPSRTRVQRMRDEIQRLKNKTVHMDAAGAEIARGKIAALRDAINSLRSRTITINYHGVRTGAAVGGRTAQAYGNLYPTQHYAFGDIANRHMPELAGPGPTRVWREPETQGEAYIPLANDDRRPRARAIAAETVSLLGGTAHFAQGGVQHFAKGGVEHHDGRAQLRHRFHELSKAVYDSTKAIDRERSRRDALVAKRDELKGNVADKFKTDLFGDTSNVWAAGGGDTLGVLKADIAKAKAFQHTLKGLRQQGLNGDALADIASTGDIGKAQALASLGKSGIARYEKLYDQRTRAANQVGAYAGLAAYGTQIAKQTHELRKNFHELNAMKHHLALMRKELAHHPKKTGEAVGHAVNHAAAAGHRRKS